MKTTLKTIIILSCVSALLTGCGPGTPMNDALNQVTWPTLGNQPGQKDQNKDQGEMKKAEASPDVTEAANPTDCPKVTIAPDLNTAPQFEDITAIKSDGILATNVMTLSNHSCTVEQGIVTIEVALNFEATRGKAGEKAAKAKEDGFYSYPYFMAIADPAGAIVAKDVFAVTMNFKPTDNKVANTENLRQTITLPPSKPNSPAAKASDYSLVLGFQLNLAELEYIREMASKPAQ